VFCRAPVPGRVKTRLSPELTPHQAAGLGAAMLLDVTAALSRDDLELWVAVARAEDRGPVAALLPPRCEVAVQSGGDLGERMRNAIRAGLERGSPAVALVGSDCPEVTADQASEALHAVQDGADLAVCPSGDGGYSLIAATADIGAVFQRIPWSTPEVMRLTLAAARRAGLRVRRLDPLHDVDRPPDLARVTGDPTRASPVAARTRAVVTVLGATDPDWHSRVESANSPSLY
jgi:rSAM/selenodomain-associated transferase 1